MPCSSRITSEMTLQSVTIATMEIQTGLLSTLVECNGNISMTSLV